MYALNKRATSQYVRRECKRRLRLDLYKGVADRNASGAPDRDAGRPGLALLVAQGREFERQKFQELVDAFPGLVVHGPRTTHAPGEERAFDHLDLGRQIDASGPGTILTEAQYAVPSSFMDIHDLGDLRDGLLGRDARLELAEVSPDNLHVVEANGTPREAIMPEGTLLTIGAEDKAGGRSARRVDAAVPRNLTANTRGASGQQSC